MSETRPRREGDDLIVVEVVVSDHPEVHWVWPGTPIESILAPGVADDLRRGLLEAYDEEGQPCGFGAPLDRHGARITLRLGRLEQVLPPQERELLVMHDDPECRRAMWEAICALGYRAHSFCASTWDELLEHVETPTVDDSVPPPWFLIAAAEALAQAPSPVVTGAGVLGLVCMPRPDIEQPYAEEKPGGLVVFHIASPRQQVIGEAWYRAYLLFALAGGATMHSRDLARALRLFASDFFGFEMVAQEIVARHLLPEFSQAHFRRMVYECILSFERAARISALASAMTADATERYQRGYLAQPRVVRKVVEEPQRLLLIGGGGTGA